MAITLRRVAKVIFAVMLFNIALIMWRHKPNAPAVHTDAKPILEAKLPLVEEARQDVAPSPSATPPLTAPPAVLLVGPPKREQWGPHVFCAFSDDKACLNPAHGAAAESCAHTTTPPVFWPVPGSVSLGAEDALLASDLAVEITVSTGSPDRAALDEAADIIRHHLRSITTTPYELGATDAASGCVIPRLEVTVARLGLSDVPRGRNERYELECTSAQITVKADEVWGVIRALQTLRQAVRVSGSNAISVSATPLRVTDEPRYGFRAFLIDSARNPLSVDFIVALVRLMAAYKLNVLHWHLTDDHNFGIELDSHPLLWRGQFWHYSKADIRRVIAEGRRVGVRVMPEVNPFSHAASWKTGYKHLVPNCPHFACNDAWSVGLNVIRPETYRFISDVLSEVMELFPDPLMHLGGDEPFTGCWEEDPEVKAWLAARGQNAADALYAHHHAQMAPIYARLNRTILMWQEAWYAPPKPLHAAAHILWKGPEEWDTWSPGLMRDERAGIIYASSWYFDATCKSWSNCYSRNPMSDPKHDSLWGLLAAAWEVDMETYFELNMLKRLIAVSEVFWSPYAARAALLPSLDQRMASVCKATDERDARTGEFFANVGKVTHYSYCNDAPAITQRDLQRWVQRQTERDMYVCSLIHYASVGSVADCNTPYCKRNRNNPWWQTSQSDIQAKIMAIEWDG